MINQHKILNINLDEQLECFDENENIIKPQTRRRVHTKPPRVWHGVTIIWIFTKKHQILCSKRSNLVEGNPGKWQTYFGGHVKSGVSFLQTAQIELKEEIGL